MQPKDTQESPSSNQSGTPPTQHMFESSVPLQTDHLITGDNEKVYAFHHSHKHLSLKQRFGLLSRTRQVLLVVGSVSVVFIVSMVVLTFVMYEPPRKSSTTIVTKSSAVTEDLNNDGVVDTEDAKVAAGDANKDGVVDDKDLAFVEADLNSDGVVDEEDTIEVTDEDIAWWQELIGKIKGVEEESAGEDEVATTDEYNYDSEEAPAKYEESDDSAGTEPSEVNDQVIVGDTAPVVTVTNTPREPINITTASWNALRVGNNTSNLRAGVKEILKSADVIGLQEIGEPSFSESSLDGMASQSIGVYQPSGNTPIVWNNAKYVKRESGAIKTSGSGKYITYVRLENRSTKHQLYVFNVHMQTGTDGASEGCSSAACLRYKAQMKDLVAAVKRRQASRIPIFVTGDFNINYRYKMNQSCRITWQPCYALKCIGLVSNYAALNLKGISSSASTINEATHLIDYVFFWKDMSTQAVSNSIIGPNASCRMRSSGKNDCWHGSDHKPLLFTAKISGD